MDINLTGCSQGFVVMEFFFVTPGGNSVLQNCPFYLDNFKIDDITNGADPETANDSNYIFDNQFSKGAEVYDPIKPPLTHTGTLNFGKDLTGQTAQWWITQWNSRNDIYGTPGQRVGSEYQYSNDYKTVSRSDDGVFTLRENAGYDYLAPRTTSSQPWIHLYLEQRYSNFLNVGKYNRANLKFDFKIPLCVNATNPMTAYDPNIHASIAVIYFLIQDINPNSPGYRDFINYGIPLFDDRLAVPQKYTMIDATDPNSASYKLIYTTDGNLLYDSATADGNWHSVNTDVMPYIREAYAIARNSNCMQNSKLEDLGLSQICLGFENAGMFNAEMKIKNLYFSCN